VTCTKCGLSPRLAGSRSTWCRECKNEWQRGYRAGVRLQKRIPDPVRDANGCLLWQGYVDHEGYPRVTHQGQPGQYAHRVAYEKANGVIPDGLTIDHLCEVKICVAPAHLEACPRGENVSRYYDRRAS
jgi:hypothetical protein